MVILIQNVKTNSKYQQEHTTQNQYLHTQPHSPQTILIQNVKTNSMYQGEHTTQNQYLHTQPHSPQTIHTLRVVQTTTLKHFKLFLIPSTSS